MAFNKYQVIKNAVSYELANFIFNYFLLKRDAVDFMYKNNITYDNGTLGTWTDKQIPNTYSHYADMVMETLMMKVLPKMQQETGLELIPTYSYARIYKKGDELKRHKDRPSCEISTTVNLGGDPWPIFIDGTGQDTVIDEYKNIHKPKQNLNVFYIFLFYSILDNDKTFFETNLIHQRANDCVESFYYYLHHYKINYVLFLFYLLVVC